MLSDNILLRVEAGAEKGTTHVQVRVFYDKGGLNHFTSRDDKRGVYVVVTPIEVIKYADHDIVKTGLFSGYKKLLVETKRKSDKTLDEQRACVSKQVAEKTGVAWEMVEAVLSKHGLTLAQTSEQEGGQ